MVARALIGIGLAAALGGCAGGLAIEGRAVEGPASVVVPVDAGDARLGSAGAPVEGATVTVRVRKPDGPVVATATTGPDGRFCAKLPNPSLARSELAVIAAATGHLPARSVIFLPERGREVLVVLERIGGAGGSAASAPTNR
ncbi:MAG: carboxypeptidase regulatory-like domain-containing protein [Phycisphaerae bacterium]|nr:carboxypeptidase regulatory-like domain-containing protein [Phycisphaerae bacterium]